MRLQLFTTKMQMWNTSPFALLLGSLVYYSGNLELNLGGNPYVEVDTLQGRLRGVKNVARDGKIYMEFLGIPYAQPPVGDLRFEPPQPPPAWRGVRDATHFGRSCLQYEYFTHFRTGHEDCLTLNVYTPQVQDSLAPLPLSELKPVIVYLYGGLFMSGFTYTYRPKYFMENADVVFVTVNYRVSSFGFLNTGDDVVRGNMGLKDQTMALRWVNKNIARFGGDPYTVTLMGQSAGAASAQYHLLSPLSTGFFHRAILQSGSALSPGWAFSENPAEKAKRLGEYLNCPVRNSTEMVACLKQKRAHEIARFHKEYLGPFPDPSTIFSPSVEAVDDENTFLRDTPRNLFASGEIVNRVPVIIGVNSNEGYFTTLYSKSTGRAHEEIASNPMQIIRSLGRSIMPKRSQSLINEYYFNNGTGSDEEFDEQLSKQVSDGAFNHPLHESIKYMAPHMPVYAYYFTYAGEGSISRIQELMVPHERIPRAANLGIGVQRKWLEEHTRVYGLSQYSTSELARPRKPKHVAHADELAYQFNIPVIADEMVPGTKNGDFSRAFVKLWKSFARDGQPSTLRGIEWTPAMSGSKRDSNMEYLEIGASPAMIREPFRDSMRFLRSLNVS